MKIALLTDGFFPFVMGGMQKHSYYLAKYLAKEQVEVDLFFYKKDDAEIPFSKAELNFINLIELEFPANQGYIGHYIFESLEYSKRIFELIESKIEGYDFIYAQGFCAWELLNQKKKLNYTTPIAVNLHGLEMFQKAPSFKGALIKKMFYYPAIQNLRMPDYVFSLGGKLTGILKERTSSTVLEIPIGVEETWLTKEIKPANSKRKFLFVGRYERRKGIEELNQVLRNFDPEKEFEFHFVGPIPDSKQIEDPRVIYHGRIMDEFLLRGIYQDSDVFVCPSYSEGMPTVILEAMASGCAIIATNVGAVAQEVIPGKNGWFVEPGDKRSLSKGISSALEINNGSLMAMKLFSRERVEKNFLWKKVVKDTLSILKKELLAK